MYACTLCICNYSSSVTVLCRKPLWSIFMQLVKTIYTYIQYIRTCNKGITTLVLLFKCMKMYMEVGLLPLYMYVPVLLSPWILDPKLQNVQLLLCLVYAM